MRVLRRVLLLVPALLVLAAVAVVLAARPQLENAEDDVERAWAELASSLDARYELLAATTAAIGDTPGPSGELADELDRALGRWRNVRAEEASVDTQVEAANALEGLARRLDVTVRASPRVSAVPEVIAALDAFVNAPPPGELAAFEAAARAYAKERSGISRSVVAGLLDYEAVPALDMDGSP